MKVAVETVMEVRKKVRSFDIRVEVERSLKETEAKGKRIKSGNNNMVKRI